MYQTSQEICAAQCQSLLSWKKFLESREHILREMLVNSSDLVCEQEEPQTLLHV